MSLATILAAYPRISWLVTFMFCILYCIYFRSRAETVSYNSKFITKSSRGRIEDKEVEELERKLVKQEFKQKERQEAENMNKGKIKRNNLDCNICFLIGERG